jgi:hypothetical protein
VKIPGRCEWVAAGPGAAADAAAPPGQPQGPCPSRVRTTGAVAVTWNAQGARLEPGVVLCPVMPGRRRELISEPGMPSAELAGQAREVDQDMRLLRLLQRLQRRHHCR